MVPTAKPPSTPPKVAVLVIHGVDGDRDQSGNHRRLATGLLRARPGAFAVAKDDSIRITTIVDSVGADGSGAPPTPEAGRRGSALVDVVEAKLTRLVPKRAGRPQVDVIGITWTDISRFPTKVLAFVPSLFALLLQMTTFGLEAQRGMHPFGTPTAAERADSGRLGRVAEPALWLWFGIPATAVVAALAVSVHYFGLGWDTFWLIAPIAVLAVLGAGLFVGVLTTNRRRLKAARIHEGPAQRRPQPMRTAQVLVLSAIEALSWWLAAVIIPLTVVLASFAVAFWLAVKADAFEAGLVALLVGAFLTWLVGRGLVEAGWRYGNGNWVRVLDPRAWSVAAIGAGAIVLCHQIVVADRDGPVGIGNALLTLAAFGLRPAWWITALLATGAVMALLILLAVKKTERAAAANGLITVTLVPALIAGASLLLFAGLGSVALKELNDSRWGAQLANVQCLSTPQSWRAEPCDPRLAAELAAAEEAPSDPEAEMVDLENEAGLTPAGWARRLFGQIAGPLVAALMISLVVLLVGFGYQLLRVFRRPPGSLVSRLYRCALRWPGRVLAGVGSFATLGVVLLGWFPLEWTPDWLHLESLQEHIGEFAARGGEPSAALAGWSLIAIGAAAAVGKWLKLDPTGGALTGEATGALSKIRDPIDRVYDVATYLRIDRGGQLRDRMVSRVRAAVNAALADGEYDALVIAAHSQGSVLAAAAILGDDSREHRIAPRIDAHGKPIVLLTFGSPIRQLYAGFFPDQAYGRWVGSRPDEAPMRAAGRQRIAFWLNVYRPRDILGRALFVEPHEPEALAAGTRSLRDDVPDVTCAIDRCLAGRGGHTGYWDDPRIWRALALAIDQALIRRGAPSNLRCPPRDEIETALADAPAPPRSATERPG